jgi:hypothetical protein
MMSRLALSTKGEDLALLGVASRGHDAEGKVSVDHRSLLALAANGSGSPAVSQQHRNLQVHSVTMLATSLAIGGGGILPTNAAEDVEDLGFGEL